MRLENKPDFYRPFEQAGHLQCLKFLIEKSVEYNRPLALIFVDFHKAFDSISLQAVIESLDKCRVDYRYTKVIYNIYKNATIKVQLDTSGNSIPVERRVSYKGTLYHPNYLFLSQNAQKTTQLG